MPFSNEKLLLLLFTALHCSSAFAHLELLIFNLQTAILLLGTIIEQTYKANNKIHLRTVHQNKERL